MEREQSQEIINHSPTGFEWGYGGISPAQLALALLLMATGDAKTARRYYQDFKWEFVAEFNFNEWEITQAEILHWIQKQEGTTP